MEEFLKTKIEKNVALEMQLDELKDAYVCLEQSLSGEDKNYRQKLLNLEQSNDKISQMYNAVVYEKSILKVDLQVSDRKLQRVQQKQDAVEKKYESCKVKNKELTDVIQMLKAEFLKMQKEMSQQDQKGGGVSRAPINGTRAAIRGGGGKRLTTPRTQMSVEVVKGESLVQASIRGGAGRNIK